MVRVGQDFEVDFNVDTKRDKVVKWTLEEWSLPNLLNLFKACIKYKKSKKYIHTRLSLD